MMDFIRSILWGLFTAGLFTLIAPNWMILYSFMFLGFFAFAFVCAVPILFFLDYLAERRAWK